MSKPVDTLKRRFETQVGGERHTRRSLEWFRVNARKLGARLRTSQVARDRDRLTDRPLPGRMYMYNYDPKLKNELPYYDAFPLVFVVKYYDNGFLGLNLHYLPPKLRLELFDALLNLATNDKYDETTRLRISWSIVQSMSKSKYVKPTVKRYLYKQLRSLYIEVPADEWEIALFLPLERFRKGSRQKVWSDSRRMI